MQTAQQAIVKLLFGKENFPEVGREEIVAMVDRYPYLNALRYLLAAKSAYVSNGAVTDEQVTAGLYVNNPLWLNYLLTKVDHTVVQEQVASQVPEEEKMPDEEPPAEESGNQEEFPIAFQSYHTIDYFASQGIRLQQDDLSKDKFGQQLKSFTEWLRSMKKLPSTQQNSLNQNGEDDFRQQHVIQSAAHSIEEKEVVTEAMAEVWVKQGNADKARALYTKLSLQNPDKSAYFAAKLDQLK